MLGPCLPFFTEGAQLLRQNVQGLLIAPVLMPSPDTAQVQPAARLHAAEIPHHHAEMGQAQGGLQLPSCLGLAAQGLQHPHSDRTAQKPQRLAAPIAEGRLLGFQPKIQTLLRTHRGIILSTRFIFEADNPDLRCLEVEGVRTGMILVWKEREPQGPLHQLIRAFPTTEDPPAL